MLKKGIIFDLDGTLWDSSAQVVTAWNKVLARRGHLQITIDDMQSLMGKTMTDIFMILLPSESEQNRVRIAEECCVEEQNYLRENGGVLFPKVLETLEELSRQYQLFIVSNCQNGYIESFLDYYQLNDRFTDTECFGRTLKLKGENIKIIVERNHLEKAVYVGDTKLDFESAKIAGIPFIHAKYGYGEAVGALYSICTFAELPRVVSKIFKPFTK